VQPPQAEPDRRIAQAKAAERQYSALAAEQEQKASTQAMRAKVVEAEAQIPQAIAEAFRNGKPDPLPPLAENGIELEIQKTFGQHPKILNEAPLYALVEKILEPGEELPDEWPVDGTSGYEFTNLVNGIFIQQKNERDFTRIYHRYINGAADVDMLIYNSKKLIMHIALASEVNVLTNLLAEICGGDRHARDFTLKTLRDAIRETIACFPVYRTYIDERGQYTPRDREYVEHAIRRAKRFNPSMNVSVFDYLRSVLLLQPKRYARSEGAAAEGRSNFLLFGVASSNVSLGLLEWGARRKIPRPE